MMALTRRGVFRAAAGAAIAGPGAVKSVLESSIMSGPSGFASLPVGYGVGSALEAIAPDQSWIKHEIEELVKQKAKTERQKPKSRCVRAEHFRIDGLRSVSAQHRASMMQEVVVKIERENQVNYLDERLAELKERLGLLGHFI